MRPNFLIIGAPRAGTTSLFRYLGRHEQIFLPHLKEPHYFTFVDRQPGFCGPRDPDTINKDAVTSIYSYLDLFSSWNGQRCIGEASTSYLHMAGAAKNIYEFNPNMKIIAILRDPVERAYSDYLYVQKEGGETTGHFLEALEEEAMGKRKDWWHGRYICAGAYFTNLMRYYELFREEQIQVIFFEDLSLNPQDVIREVCQFLGLHHEPENMVDRAHNQAGRPRSAFLHALYQSISRPHAAKDILLKSWLPEILRKKFRRQILEPLHNLNIKKEQLSRADRQVALKYFEKEIALTEGFLHRDLSAWKC